MSKYEEYLSEGGEAVELSAPKKRSTSVLSLRVPCELMDRLGELAEEHDTSTGALARSLIQEGLERRAGWRGHFTLTEGSAHSISKAALVIYSNETGALDIFPTYHLPRKLRHGNRMIADAADA